MLKKDGREERRAERRVCESSSWDNVLILDCMGISTARTHVYVSISVKSKAEDLQVDFSIFTRASLLCQPAAWRRYCAMPPSLCQDRENCFRILFMTAAFTVELLAR